MQVVNILGLEMHKNNRQCWPMIETLQPRIVALLQQPGITKVLIAAQAKVHRNTLNGLEHEGWHPAPRTLEAIAAVVDKLEQQ